MSLSVALASSGVPFVRSAMAASSSEFDFPDDPVMAVREAEKVGRWCAEQEIESTADLAFFFTSAEQALEEAGRAVARAWHVARGSAEQGVAGLVKNLFLKEGGAAKAGVPPRPSTSPEMRPKVKAMPKPAIGARKRTFEKAIEANKAGFVRKFVAMLLIVGTHRNADPSSMPWSGVTETNFEEVARAVCSRSESATLKRALQTWDELHSAVTSGGLAWSAVGAHFLAQFVRDSKSSSRVYVALHWIKRNFAVDLDLTAAWWQVWWRSPGSCVAADCGSGDRRPPDHYHGFGSMVSRAVRVANGVRPGALLSSSTKPFSFLLRGSAYVLVLSRQTAAN